MSAVRSALSVDFPLVVIDDEDIDFSSIENDFRRDNSKFLDFREKSIPEGQVLSESSVDYNPIPVVFGDKPQRQVSSSSYHGNTLDSASSEIFEPIPLQNVSQNNRVPKQVISDDEEDLPVEAFPDDDYVPQHHPAPQVLDTVFAASPFISDVTGDDATPPNSDAVDTFSSAEESYSDVSDKEIEQVLSDDSTYFENYDFDIKSAKKFRDYQTDQWQRRYRELKQVFLETGKSTVHHADTSKKCLARWIKRQRAQYKLRQEGKSSSMTDDRIDALNLIHFVWDSHNTVWEDRVRELEEFQKKHNHCNVTPTNYPFGSSLISWVKSQRRQYRMMKDGKKSNLTPRRIQQLESLGFQF